MEFNIQKFLVENKLTKRSTLKEDDNTGAMLKTDAEQGEMSDEEGFEDEKEDTWFKDDSDDSGDFEKEPSAKDVTKDEPSVTGIHKKQADLKALENQKDALLMQLKGNVITLDQYKTAIGNIPAQIKKLRADIEKTMNVSVDDEDAEL